MSMYVQPCASRTELAGWHGTELKIRLAASPIDNAANVELIAFIAQRLRIPKRNIRLVRGRTGRRKTLEISGAGAEAIAALHCTAPVESAGALRKEAAQRARRDAS
jgi:uncharacterized protein